MKRIFLIVAVPTLLVGAVAHKTLNISFKLAMNFVFFPFAVLAACTQKVVSSPKE